MSAPVRIEKARHLLIHHLRQAIAVHRIDIVVLPQRVRMEFPVPFYETDECTMGWSCKVHLPNMD